MKSIIAIVCLVLAGSVCGQAVERCPICHSEVVDVTTQKDDESKPSRNMSVWNRSSCANLFFGKGSLICPRDGYAYEAEMKRWELSLGNRDLFAFPLDRRITGLPLPGSNDLPNGTVYSQNFASLAAVQHGIAFWTPLNEDYFKKSRQYAKLKRIHIAIERHRDRGEAYISATVTTKTEQAAPSDGDKPPN